MEGRVRPRSRRQREQLPGRSPGKAERSRGDAERFLQHVHELLRRGRERGSSKYKSSVEHTRV